MLIKSVLYLENKMNSLKKKKKKKSCEKSLKKNRILKELNWKKKLRRCVLLLICSIKVICLHSQIGIMCMLNKNIS